MTAVPLSLSNGSIRLVVDAARGGAITELAGGPSGDTWLFHDSARAAGRPPDHPVYDDVWCGGFEELFPNDAAGDFDGRALPDHGELWNSPFEVVGASAAKLHLRRDCRTVPAAVEKSILLDASGPGATIRYRLASRGVAPLWHLFKLHPAVRVEAGDRLLLPGGTVTPVEPGFGRLSGAARHRWPVELDDAGAPLDLSLVRPPEERFREFVYVSDLPEGWCGIRRGRTGEALTIRYPLDVFPFCWLFITYGGWRDYHTAVLEPCTNVPKDLAAARERGTRAVLGPGEVKEFAVRIEIRGPDAG